MSNRLFQGIVHQLTDKMCIRDSLLDIYAREEDEQKRPELKNMVERNRKSGKKPFKLEIKVLDSEVTDAPQKRPPVRRDMPCLLYTSLSHEKWINEHIEKQKSRLYLEKTLDEKRVSELSLIHI